MPVLDAKALDLDPKGAAFLMSVLRQTTLSPTSPNEGRKIGRVHLHFRVMRRLKELQTDTV